MIETVTISREDYNRLLNAQQDLEGSRAIGRAMADIAAGRPTLSSAEADEYLAAVTPLAFWRKRAGKAQSALADETGVPQAELARIEAGQAEGSVGVFMKLARAMGIRVEDLVAE